MAGLRTAIRLAPRSHLIRPTRITPATQQRYVTGYSGYEKQNRRPATDTKPVIEAEEAQEDLVDGDPNMVRLLRAMLFGVGVGFCTRKR